MNVKFYSLTSLPAAVAGAAGSFVNVTAGENAGMYYCTGDKFIRLDNVAQDRTGEINAASIDTATGIVSFKNGDAVKFTVNLAGYLAAEIAKLDGSAVIASNVDGVVTIKAGVSEVDGKISNASGDDIVLKKVATTGKAADILMDAVPYPSDWEYGHGTNIIESGASLQDELGAFALMVEGHIGDNIKSFTAISASISAINSDIATTLDSAKSYADTQDAVTLASAKTYTDTQDSVTLASAKSYADTQVSATLASAKAYTDTTAKSAAAEAVAAVVAGADSDFDTLKEVADWIMSDTTGAAALQTDVAGLKTKVSTLESASHTHANKAELDKIADGDKAKWDTHVANADIHVTAEQKTAWSAKQDAFNNAAVLSAITSTQVTNWDNAFAKAHEHANKTVLDGITADKVAAWDGAVSAAGVSSVGGKAGALTLKGGSATLGDVNLSISDTGEISAAIVPDSFDVKGAAATALNDAKAYTDEAKGECQTLISNTKTDIIGTDGDDKSANTINGAKAYADDVVAAALVWLSNFPTA